MPIIIIKVAKGRTIEQKRELVRSITEQTARILRVKPEWVSVIIDEYDRENWATGGELQIDKFGEGHGQQGT
jgi:4-oxalocrotonate tautomerase